MLNYFSTLSYNKNNNRTARVSATPVGVGVALHLMPFIKAALQSSGYGK